MILTFTLSVYPVFSFATQHLVPVRVGQLLRMKLKTMGAVGQVKLKVLSGRFPVGVRLDGNVRLHGNEGLLQGRPRHRGFYRFVIEAQDSLGRITTRAFGLSVRPR
jgi:hypothetical protein